jgi:putative ABC transport system permease protein
VRSWLVAVQTALALALVAIAGLMAAGYERTAQRDPGFDPRGVFAAQVRLPADAYPTVERRALFIDQVLGGIRSVPGVVAAGTTSNLLVPGFYFVTLVEVEGRPAPGGVLHTVDFRRVSPGYFETLRVALRRGRLFDPRDTSAALPVAIVSEGLAKRFWPGEDPIGRRLKRGAPGAPWMAVVGVVDDVSDVGLADPPHETLYLPVAQNSNPAMPVTLVVRTAGEPLASAAAVASVVRDVDPLQPLSGATSLERFLDASLGPQRFRTVLVAWFGALGLVLAVVGTYGVTARHVAERTREIGVRLALGGRPAVVWRGVSLDALRAVSAGWVLGSCATAAAALALPAVLPDLQGESWAPPLVAVVAVLVSGGGAACVAAARAARIDPLSALRSESDAFPLREPPR